MKICVVTLYYLPARKAGGPVPGIQGVISALDGHDVHVMTGDRDLGDATPYPEPFQGRVMVDGSAVNYLPKLHPNNAKVWLQAIRELVNSDVAYLNTLHNFGFTVIPILALAFARYRGAVVISPRGELAGSARKLGHTVQKKLWAKFLRWCRLDVGIGSRHNVAWLASSEHEKQDILAVFPNAKVWVSPEQLRPLSNKPAIRTKEHGWRIIVVGRLAPVKGSLELIRALQETREPVVVEFVGPAEDEEYVRQMKAAAEDLPSTVTLEWTGALSREDLALHVRRSNLFVSLTRGENFGHAIGEALRDGCPVLISDQTPWTQAVTSGAGAVLSAADCSRPTVVAHELDRLAQLAEPDYEQMSARAIDIAAEGLQLPGSKNLLEVVAQIRAGSN